MEAKIKNMLRLFLDSIRDYELESGHSIAQDERNSEEFVDIFLDSEDAFDYQDLNESFRYHTICARSTLYPGKSIDEVNKIVDEILTGQFPIFVRLGSTALRLKGDEYWRDGGRWGVKYRYVDGKLVSWAWGKGMPHLHKQPLIRITEKEWRKDNYPYAPKEI